MIYKLYQRDAVRHDAIVYCKLIGVSFSLSDYSPTPQNNRYIGDERGHAVLDEQEAIMLRLKFPNIPLFPIKLTV